MKKLFNKIIHSLRACPTCHGMGVIELPSGDTKKCQVCNGKGMI